MNANYVQRNMGVQKCTSALGGLQFRKEHDIYMQCSKRVMKGRRNPEGEGQGRKTIWRSEQRSTGFQPLQRGSRMEVEGNGGRRAFEVVQGPPRAI